MPRRSRSYASRPPRRLILIGALAALLAGLGGMAGLVRGAGNDVVVLTATGTVDNVMAGYLADGVQNAAAAGAPAVVVQLNTPGGSLDSTQRITSAFLEGHVPVIVWITPSGGRAASAGTFITMAANLAYMSPGTNIGAASPVDSNGQDIPGTLGEKVKNDAIANMTAIAEARGRPVPWAVSTVSDAKSYSANEAVAAGAVDGIATTINDVLQQANGKEVTVAGAPVTLALEGVGIDQQDMNPFQGLLHVLSDPNIAFLLFTIGTIGVIIELLHPNFVTGILGALAIILAFIGFGSLPLNLAGLLLIVLGIILLVLEFSVTSHGLLAIGGIICFVLGASALYTNTGDPTEPIATVALPVIFVTTATTAILMGFITLAAIRTRRMAAPKGTVGVAIPLGTAGVVQVPLDPAGTAYFAGESWSARTADNTPVPRDTPIRLVAFDGLTAIVEPTGEPAATQPAGRGPEAPYPANVS
ncbi:MAG TPA: NfeD family protein [Candidatus Limnocylindrales bacterium]|jgi:membrane-bound serine protease (ClpP class)